MFHALKAKLRDPAPDLLTVVLREAGLQRRLLAQRTVEPGIALRFPCDRSLGVHVAVQGRAWLHAPTLAEPLALEAGDLVLMARGCLHHIATTPDPLVAENVVQRVDAPLVPPAPAPVPAGAAVVVSGAYQLWHAPVHPVLSALPDWSLVRGRSLSPLAPLPLALGLVADEAGRGAQGSETVLSALLDVVFALLLREILASGRDADAPAAAGWGRAVADPRIGRALAAMQTDCARAWTLEELAREAGISRTAFAARFRDTLGDTPANHLRTLRMQRAMRLLADTDQPLEAIAAAVGYQDAFGFSKVFKRTVGESPRAFRQRDAADRSSPWRIRTP